MAKAKRKGGAPLKAPGGLTAGSALYVRLDDERRRRLRRLVAAHQSRTQAAVVTQADVVRLLIDNAFEVSRKEGSR